MSAQHGGLHGGDRRPWLIISRREAQAVLAILRDYIDGAPELEDEDLLRAERVITRQLAYIQDGPDGRPGVLEPNVTTTLIREMRA